jgi:O-antigen/teichoic acid export membrane protein
MRAGTRLVARNAFWSLLVTMTGMPLAMVTNALLARKLGPAEFGTFYLATTLVSLAAVGAEMGQGTVLQGVAARERDAAGSLATTTLLVRLTTFVISVSLLAVIAFSLGYDRHLLLVLLLVSVTQLFSVLGFVGPALARAFERPELLIRPTVIWQIAQFACVVAALFAGFGLVGVVAAQALAMVYGGWLDLNILKRIPVKLTRPRLDRARELFNAGTGFFVLNLVLALQPNLDAVMLSKLSSEEVIGWHAVSRRILGFLMLPAGAVMASLYPTLVRLWAEDQAAACATMRAVLRTVTMLVLPAALGCALFPGLGVQIFNRATFGPAEDNLRVLSLFIVPLYFSMVLGTCLMAQGKQRAWAIVQLACVAVSAVLNPFLIPYFQRTHGNGGLGVSITTVMSELLMLGAAIAMTPPGLFDARLYKKLGLAALAAGGMAAFALALRSITPWVVAPLSVVVYVLGLRLTGCLEATEIERLRAKVMRRFRRA